MTEHSRSNVHERRRASDIELALLRQQMEATQLELLELKACKAKTTEDLEGKLDKLAVQLNKIELKLNKQQTFIGGVVWTATGFIAFAAFALNYFKH